MPNSYREWLVPAKLINEHSTVTIAGGKKLMSGGQTGVDRAALDVALELGISYGGWCPKGRLAEDGVIPSKYPLEETLSAEYHECTECNVAEAKGTLILTIGQPEDGTALTIDFTRKHHRPCLVVDLAQPVDFASVKEWIASNHINILNVAGPRASKHPDIYDRAKEVLRKVLA
jgi:hypothetical protein